MNSYWCTIVLELLGTSFLHSITLTGNNITINWQADLLVMRSASMVVFNVMARNLEKVYWHWKYGVLNVTLCSSVSLCELHWVSLHLNLFVNFWYVKWKQFIETNHHHRIAVEAPTEIDAQPYNKPTTEIANWELKTGGVCLRQNPIQHIFIVLDESARVRNYCWGEST
jgi:hypothetical protein